MKQMMIHWKRLWWCWRDIKIIIVFVVFVILLLILLFLYKDLVKILALSQYIYNTHTLKYLYIYTYV